MTGNQPLLPEHCATFAKPFATCSPLTKHEEGPAVELRYSEPTTGLGLSEASSISKSKTIRATFLQLRGTLDIANCPMSVIQECFRKLQEFPRPSEPNRYASTTIPPLPHLFPWKRLKKNGDTPSKHRAPFLVGVVKKGPRKKARLDPASGALSSSTGLHKARARLCQRGHRKLPPERMDFGCCLGQFGPASKKLAPRVAGQRSER